MRLLPLLISLLAASTVRAQVNAERIRAQTRRPGGHLGFDASINWRGGNIDFLAASLGLTLGYHGGEDDERPHTALFYGSAGYAEIGDSPYLSQALAHARWNWKVHPHVAPDLFVQVQYDAFLQLRIRGLGGGGARVTLLDAERIEILAGSGYMLEREVFQPLPDDEPHPVASVNHRWTNYFTLSADLDETLSLSSTLYVQPRFDDFSDYRVYEEVSFTLKSATVFAISLGLWLRYDSDPPTVLERLDVGLVSKLHLLLHRAPDESEGES